MKRTCAKHTLEQSGTKISQFIKSGITIKKVINNMVFDAKPVDAISKALRDSMLSFMSAMAEAQTIAKSF